jgi:hypothetical protein
MWNSILAGIIFEHVSIEGLRRKLRCKAQFREMCLFFSIDENYYKQIEWLS